MNAIIEENIGPEGIIVAQCSNCVHLHRGTVSCDAFKRIPDEILINKFNHKKPYKGDKGIQFEPIEEENE